MATAAAPAHAQFGIGPTTPGSKLVDVRFETDRPSIGPGQTVNVLVRLRIEPHWHVYWRNPGDAGTPTEFSVTAPKGFTVHPPRFPRPRTFAETDGRTFGYEREVTFFLPVTAPKALGDGAIEIDVEVFYLVCKESCIMGDAKGTVEVETTSRPEPAPRRAEIDALRKRLAQPITALKGATAKLEGDRLVITGPSGGFESAVFYPDAVPGVTIGGGTIRFAEGRFTLEAPVELDAGNALGKPMAVRGLLAFGSKLDDPSYDVDVPVAAPAAHDDDDEGGHP